eukprot:2154516-Prymnesium_polylepis.1
MQRSYQFERMPLASATAGLEAGEEAARCAVGHVSTAVAALALPGPVAWCTVQAAEGVLHTLGAPARPSRS